MLCIFCYLYHQAVCVIHIHSVVTEATA